MRPTGCRSSTPTFVAPGLACRTLAVAAADPANGTSDATVDGDLQPVLADLAWRWAL